MTRLSHRGVTLIELMITLAILGILVVLALPGYSRWIHNTKIRTAADAALNGLQLARGESVQRNANVVFAFTTGTGWTVTSGSTVVQTRSAGEGSSNVILTNVNPATATRVTFNGLGRVIPNTNGSPSLLNFDLDVSSAILSAADSRELRIIINSGQVRLCDPDVGLSAGDPRKC